MSTYTAPKPLNLVKDPLTDGKIGRVDWRASDDQPRQEISVRIKSHNRGASYDLEVAYPKVYRSIGQVVRDGAGRNLSYTFYENGRPNHPYNQHGTLSEAVETFVRSWLNAQAWEANKDAAVKQVTALLPYQFKTEAEATNTSVLFTSEPRVAVYARVLGEFFVGYYPADEADAIAAQVRLLNPHVDTRVYGRIDPTAVIEALKEQGISAHFSNDRTEAQIHDQPNGALVIGKDGDIGYFTYDASGGVATEREVAFVKTTEKAVAAARLWYYQHTLATQAERLLDFLNEEVPTKVAHFAVEQAKGPLRQLIRNAYTVNFNYVREV